MAEEPRGKNQETARGKWKWWTNTGKDLEIWQKRPRVETSGNTWFNGRYFKTGWSPGCAGLGGVQDFGLQRSAGRALKNTLAGRERGRKNKAFILMTLGEHHVKSRHKKIAPQKWGLFFYVKVKLLDRPSSTRTCAKGLGKIIAYVTRTCVWYSKTCWQVWARIALLTWRQCRKCSQHKNRDNKSFHFFG